MAASARAASGEGGRSRGRWRGWWQWANGAPFPPKGDGGDGGGEGAVKVSEAARARAPRARWQRGRRGGGWWGWRSRDAARAATITGPVGKNDPQTEELSVLSYYNQKRSSIQGLWYLIYYPQTTFDHTASMSTSRFFEHPTVQIHPRGQSATLPHVAPLWDSNWSARGALMVVVRAASARAASARAATSRAAALRTAARVAGTAHPSHRVPWRSHPTASHRVPRHQSHSTAIPPGAAIPPSHRQDGQSALAGR